MSGIAKAVTIASLLLGFASCTYVLLDVLVPYNEYATACQAVGMQVVPSDTKPAALKPYLPPAQTGPIQAWIGAPNRRERNMIMRNDFGCLVLRTLMTADGPEVAYPFCLEEDETDDEDEEELARDEIRLPRHTFIPHAIGIWNADMTEGGDINEFDEEEEDVINIF